MGQESIKALAIGALLFIWEVSKIAILSLLIVIPIRYFIFQPFFVSGQSMEPNFYNKDYLIVDEISYRVAEPERGDVIIFKYPKNPSERYIKRIIGLPDETVEIKNNEIIIKSGSELIILDETIYFSEPVETSGNLSVSLGIDEYFVLGDNRQNSFDSRRWGAVPRKNIIGKVFLKVWPFTDFTKFKPLTY